MSNLAQKFDAFQDLTTAQHNALMAKIDLTNSKLDALLNAMGEPPPTPTATLDDILAALQTLNTTCLTLADIHQDTISMDQKLLRIRDAMAGATEALPTGEKVNMAWSLYRLMDATAPDWPRFPDQEPIQKKLYLLANFLETQLPVLDRLEDIYDALGIYGVHSSMHINEALALLINNIGYPTGDATTTALGYLACICSASNGVQPPSPSSGACGPDQFDADSVAAWNNYQWAVWNADTLTPHDLEYGTTFANMGGTGKEIRPVGGSWAGWKAFVLSQSAAYYSDRPDLAEQQLPTNVWRDLSTESNSKAFHIRQAGADIAVYLCPPDAEPPPTVDPSAPPNPVRDATPTSTLTFSADGTQRIYLDYGLYHIQLESAAAGGNFSVLLGTSGQSGTSFSFSGKLPNYQMFAVPKYHATNGTPQQTYADITGSFISGANPTTVKIYRYSGLNDMQQLSPLLIRHVADKALVSVYYVTLAASTVIELKRGWEWNRGQNVQPPTMTYVSGSNFLAVRFYNTATSTSIILDWLSDSNRIKTIPAGTYKVTFEANAKPAFVDVRVQGS